MPAAADLSFHEILQNIIGDVREIVRSQVRLTKAEIREEAARAKSFVILSGAGGVAALFAAFFVLLAIVFALSTVLPQWAAALIVGGTLAIAAGAILASSRKRLASLYPTDPTERKTADGPNIA